MRGNLCQLSCSKYLPEKEGGEIPRVVADMNLPRLGDALRSTLEYVSELTVEVRHLLYKYSSVGFHWVQRCCVCSACLPNFTHPHPPRARILRVASIFTWSSVSWLWAAACAVAVLAVRTFRPVAIGPVSIRPPSRFTWMNEVNKRKRFSESSLPERVLQTRAASDLYRYSFYHQYTAPAHSISPTP